jgi:hypothetical protein
MKPQRIQRKRVAGFDLQAESVALNGLPAVVVTRPGKYRNPFRIGGYFMVGPGAGRPGMAYCEALDEKYADSRFTKIATPEQAVEFFKVYTARYPRNDLKDLRGKNLACWCALDKPCHADVLLKIANAPVAA